MGFKFDKIKIIGAVLCVLIWSTAIPVLKILYTQLGLSSVDFFERILLAGTRFFLAGVILIVYIGLKDSKLYVVSKELFGSIVIFGLVGTTFQYITFYTGVMNTSAIKSVLLDSVKPMMVVLIAHFFSSDDKVSIQKIVGLIFGILGIIVANIDELARFKFTFSFNGEGMLIISSLMYSIAVIFGKSIMKKIKVLPLNAYQFLIGSSVMLCIGMIGCKGYTLFFTPMALALLVYSALLSAVTFVLWYKLIDRYTSSGIAVYMFLLPIFGSVISSLLFSQERITVSILFSLVLLTIGIILVNAEKMDKYFSSKER